MCGIFGYFDTRPTPDFDQRIQSAHSSLRHRGPDDKGLLTAQLDTGSLALGHTRLSIIDLSKAGRQPMTTDDGGLTIVFNGEIYNYIELRQELRNLGYQFKTNTDTEVLLLGWRQWGTELLPRITGMFAFVVFDHIHGRLQAVRDAFGIKPLFWCATDERLALGSELPTINALLKSRKKVNVQRAYDYLVHGKYDHGSECFIESVNHLLPGHLMTFDLNTPNSFRRPTFGQWWWPKTDQRPPISLADAADELRSRFLDNIRLHLRSDVPVGVALSGGVDSSALVCAIRHVEPDFPINTFSFIVPDSPINEENWIDIINAHTRANSHKVSVHQDDLLAEIDDVILAQGEPFGGTSIFAQFRVFKLARECGMKVTLEGQGGDEMLAGYNGYPAERLHTLMEGGQFVQAAKFCYAWRKWPGRSLSRALGGFAAQVSPSPLRNLLNSRRGSRRTDWIDYSSLRERKIDLRSPHSRIHNLSNRRRRLAGALRRDLTGDLLASLLRHADRNSMHWSLESRVPFLTTGLADFMLSLPEEFLVSNSGRTKHLFRIAMKGIVPDAVIERRDKIGFAPPDRSWIGHLVGLAPQWLDVAKNFPFFKRNEVLSYVRNTCSNQNRFDLSAWRIMNFCRWAQLNDVECA